MTFVISDDRHDTNFVSVSNWPKLQFDPFDFRCTSHEISVKWPEEIMIKTFIDFQMSGITRNMCQCQTDQSYNLIVLISGACHTKSVSNGARTSWSIDFQVSGFTRNHVSNGPKRSWLVSVSDDLHHTKFVYNLILLISAAIHTKSVSNGPRRSWLLWFETTGITRKLCQCQTDQNYHLIVLISGALSHEICVKWREEIMTFVTSDDRHHTKVVSVSNWPKLPFDCFDFRCMSHEICVKWREDIMIYRFSGERHHTKSLSISCCQFTRNLCQMAQGDHDFCNFRWPASHENCVSVKLTKSEINFDFLDFRFTSHEICVKWPKNFVSVSNWPKWQFDPCDFSCNSHEICVKWPKEIMTFVTSDDLHHTKVVSVSNWPKLQFDCFDFRCMSHEICVKWREDIMIFRWAASHEIIVKWPKEIITLSRFQMTGITRNLCQCQIDQNYNLIFLISSSLHTKSM